MFIYKVTLLDKKQHVKLLFFFEGQININIEGFWCLYFYNVQFTSAFDINRLALNFTF